MDKKKTGSKRLFPDRLRLLCEIRIGRLGYNVKINRLMITSNNLCAISIVQYFNKIRTNVAKIDFVWR